jgi:hypothetical protein
MGDHEGPAVVRSRLDGYRVGFFGRCKFRSAAGREHAVGNQGRRRADALEVGEAGATLITVAAGKIRIR